MSNTFTATAASIDITPNRPVPLAGYMGRKEQFEGVADPLEANVLLVEQGKSRCAFVSVDLLYSGYALRARIERILSGRLAPNEIFLAASHTHFAPATDDFLPRLGAVDERFVQFVADRISIAFDQVLKAQPSRVTIRHAHGSADHSINRRLQRTGFGRDFPFWKRRCEMRPNPAGPTDETIHLLSVTNEAGRLIAVCWCYACHPVGYPNKQSVSADFPGIVRAALRRRFGQIPVIYWQGFSGDIRPRGPVIEQGGAAAFAAFSFVEWTAWSGSLANRVIALSGLEGKLIDSDLHYVRRSVALERLGPQAGGRSLSVHEARFGDALSIFGVSAEMVVDYVKPLSASRGADITIPVGCIDGVPGYVPTSEMVLEGGYEAKTFMPLFGVRGHYSLRVSEIVAQDIVAG